MILDGVVTALVNGGLSTDSGKPALLRYALLRLDLATHRLRGDQSGDEIRPPLITRELAPASPIAFRATTRDASPMLLGDSVGDPGMEY